MGLLVCVCGGDEEQRSTPGALRGAEAERLRRNENAGPCSRRWLWK